MEFKWHFLFGFIIPYILVYFFNLPLFAGIIIFISSWIIDIDHYPWYALETKDWNPINAIKWYLKSIPKYLVMSINERKKFRHGIFICHSLLFWMILTILSFIHIFFLWVLIGIAIHMAADLIELKVRNEPLYTKIFPIYTIRKNKNKRRLTES